MKTIAEITEIRNSLLENLTDMRESNKEADKLSDMEIILGSQINILSYVLGESFNFKKGKIHKMKEDTPDFMFTYERK